MFKVTIDSSSSTSSISSADFVKQKKNMNRYENERDKTIAAGGVYSKLINKTIPVESALSAIGANISINRICSMILKFRKNHGNFKSNASTDVFVSSVPASMIEERMKIVNLLLNERFKVEYLHNDKDDLIAYCNLRKIRWLVTVTPILWKSDKIKIKNFLLNTEETISINSLCNTLSPHAADKNQNQYASSASPVSGYSHTVKSLPHHQTYSHYEKQDKPGQTAFTWAFSQNDAASKVMSKRTKIITEVEKAVMPRILDLRKNKIEVIITDLSFDTLQKVLAEVDLKLRINAVPKALKKFQPSIDSLQEAIHNARQTQPPPVIMIYGYREGFTHLLD